MQEHQQRAMQEMLFEAAVVSFRTPHGSSVDIENSLTILTSITKPTLSQAQRVLSFAHDNISSWIQATDPSTTMSALTPSLHSLVEHAHTLQDPKEAQKELTMVTKTIAEFVVAEPKVFTDEFASEIREGRFGNPQETLGDITQALLRKRVKDGGQLDYDEEESETLARALDTVISLDNPDIIEPLKLFLPYEWLNRKEGEQLFKERFPQVHTFLEQPFSHPEEKYVALAEEFITLDEEQRLDLGDRVSQKEFGDPFETFGKITSVVISRTKNIKDKDKEADIEELAEGLWIELLEMDRDDGRLRPMREELMEKKWYWDENITYTLIETIENMGIAIGQEEAFMTKHQDAIFTALQEAAGKGDSRSRYWEGIELTYVRGELPGRLAAMTAETREMIESGDLTGELPDELLFASLYTPPPKSSDK